MFEKDHFASLKIEKEALYKTFGEVYCPYFKEKVVFNSLGWEHLLFKKHGIPRFDQDQSMRLKLLHLAPFIVRQSYTLQGYRQEKRFERIRKNNRTESALKFVAYYEFIAIVGSHRVRIVIKQIEDGPKIFLSIIPYWKSKNNSKNLSSAGKHEE